MNFTDLGKSLSDFMIFSESNGKLGNAGFFQGFSVFGFRFSGSGWSVQDWSVQDWSVQCSGVHAKSWVRLRAMNVGAMVHACVTML